MKQIKQKYFSIAGMVVGAFSVIMSFVVKGQNYSSYEYRSSYGGDAYTGIQNAAATTANNIGYLTDLVAYGLFVILLVFGLACIVYFGKKLLVELEEEKMTAEKKVAPEGNTAEERKEPEVKVEECVDAASVISE